MNSPTLAHHRGLAHVRDYGTSHTTKAFGPGSAREVGQHLTGYTGYTGSFHLNILSNVEGHGSAQGIASGEDRDDCVLSPGRHHRDLFGRRERL